MNFWQFIVDVIHYTAWPITVLAVLYWFRKPMKGLLGRLKKAGAKDYYAEFAIPDLQKKAMQKVKLPEVNKDTLTWQHYLDALENWVFNLGMKLHFVFMQQPSAIDTKGMKHEMNVLKTVTEKIEKDRPNSTVIEFVHDVMKDIDRLHNIHYRPLHEIIREKCKKQ